MQVARPKEETTYFTETRLKPTPEEWSIPTLPIDPPQWTIMLQPQSLWNSKEFDGIVNWGAETKLDIFFSEQLVAKFLFSSKYIKHHDNSC